MFRVGQRPERRLGPTPFSTEWTVTPPAPDRPRRVGVRPTWLPPVLPYWFPSERTLSTLLVLVLVAATVLGAGLASGRDGDGGNRQVLAATDLTGVEARETPTEPAPTAPAPTAASQGAAADPTVVPTANVAPTAAPSAAATVAAVDAGAPARLPADVVVPEGAILPNYRVLTYYGQPWSEQMGILGEYGPDDMDGLVAKLREQAAGYEAADPSRPVKLAFEVIATVAQGEPQPDGTFLLDTDSETIEAYIDYAAENDMLVILDFQIGARGVEAEVERAIELGFLDHPHVHLALDPEFAMDEGEVPSIDLGEIDGADVTWAQERLASYTKERGLPPKMLVVHQFHYTMIENKDTVAPVPGVQLVIHSDGHGTLEEKSTTYAVVVSQEIIEYNGFKLFYSQPNEVPLMTPEEVLGLDPPPDLISYQ